MKNHPNHFRKVLQSATPILSVILLVSLGVLISQGFGQLGGPGRGSPNEALANSTAQPLATSRPGGIQENWYLAASRNIEVMEYHASMSDKGLQAPNRAHNLRTYFRDGGIEIVPRASREPGWCWTWTTRAFGREGSAEIIHPSPPSHAGSTVTYDHGALTEWYRNDSDGLEQGFSLEIPPPGNGWLCIEGAIGGDLAAAPSGGGQAINHIDFMDTNGCRVLRYGKLAAYDATGRKLPSEMLLADGSIRILVNDRDGVYPVHIDPLLEIPDWYFDGFHYNAGVGKVHTAGDVNGDGYSDVAVTTPSYWPDGIEGDRVWVFYGSAAGLPDAPQWWVDNSSGDTGNGTTAATAGDVNGDGFHDLILGAPGYDNGDGTRGRVFVYHGSSSGLSETHDWLVLSTTPDMGIHSSFGRSVSTAGDVNRDGFDDILISN